jgi:autotransporter-associated beta strand protein
VNGVMPGMTNKEKEMKKLIVMLVLGAVMSASAADVFKKDGNVNNIATATAAWSNSVVPTSSDVAVWNTNLAAATNGLNNLGSSTSWLGIRVGSALSRAVTLNAAGSEILTLGSSGIDMTSARNNFTIGTKVDLGSSQTWAVSNTKTLAVSGVISGASDKVLTKNGSGTLTLGGTNTYSGGTVLNDGTLNITANDSLGSGTLTINGGTLNNSLSVYTTNANATVINNDFTVSMTGNRGLNLGGNGISLGSAAGSSRTITVVTNVSGNGLMAFRGAIANGTTANQLIKSGDGAIGLFGTNTYNGGTVLNNGNLFINNSASLGSGVLTINGGSINANSGYISDANGVTLGNAGMVINSDFSINFVTGGGVKPLNFGIGDISLGSAGGTSRTISQIGSAAVTVGGNISDGATAKQLIINNTGGGKFTFTGTNSYSGGTVINASAGTVALAGPNTSSGGVILNAGALLEINHAEALSKGTFTINGGTFNNLSGNALTNANNGAIVINNGFIFTGSRGLDLGVGNVSLGTSNGTSRTLTLNNYYAALQLGGVVSDGTTANQLILAGPGELKLSGANTYSGGTLLNRGQISTSNETALGSGGLMIANGSTNFRGSLNLEKSLTLQGALSSGVSLTSTNFTGIDLGAAANTLTLNQSGDSEYGQGIMGSGKLVKSGLGTLTLSGTNTYTGATTVSGGKLIVNSLFNKSMITVQNGGTLGGTGSLKAVTLTAGAILAVGNSPGTMTFDGAVLLSPGSTNLMEIFTSGFDVMKGAATNKLTLAGVNLFDFAGNTVTNGATFTVFQNWGSIVNSNAVFTGINMGAGQGVTVDITGGTGVVTVIPEPAVVGLLSLGAIITLLARRIHR